MEGRVVLLTFGLISPWALFRDTIRQLCRKWSTGPMCALSASRALCEGRIFRLNNEPVIFGVHGAVAEHYKVPPAVLEPHATTLDYIVAAAAG